MRDRLHPSRQVERYQRYLIDTHPAFSDGGVGLDACAYLHNATFDPTSPIFDAAFGSLIDTNPAFTGDQADALRDFLDAGSPGPTRAPSSTRSPRPPSGRRSACSTMSRG